MEKKLKQLFEYQQFEQNEKLEKLIQETENRYAVELSDDDLARVNAAGAVTTDPYHYSGSGGGGNPIGSGGGGAGAGGGGGSSGAPMSK